MGTVDPKAGAVRGSFGRQSEIYTWTVGSGDEAGWLDLTQSPAGRVESVQVEGDFGGGSCQIVGSNDGVTGHALHDLGGMEANLSAPGVIGIMEQTRLIRPVVSGNAKLVITTYARGMT